MQEDLDSMTRAQFKRKYEDTHLAIKANTMLQTGKYSVKHNNIVHPEDRGISPNPMVPIPGKKEIEAACFKKNVEKTKGLIFDAIAVRQLEILDKEEVPMSKLLDLSIKLMPTKIEGEVEHTFSYGDMIMKAAQNIKKAEVVEVEAEEAETIEEA